jgi:hypothetical protein
MGVSKYNDKYILLAVGLIAITVTTANLQLAVAQQQSIQGFGHGSITSLCTPFRGPFPADIAFQASGTSGKLTGKWIVSNPQGEQAIDGGITSGSLLGNAYRLYGVITQGGPSSCPTNITIIGNCGSNAQIVFSTPRHELFVTAKGQVTCSG